MTVVFDASVVVDALAVSGKAGDAARRALRDVEVLQAPEVLTAEVVSALRALSLRRELDPGPARAALEAVRSMRKTLYPIDPFLDRIWELRERVTVYDAWTVSLAEHLGSELVTADERLARVAGLRCRVLRPADVA
ncbi:MAG: type II toxin-antitoxin system VapC family toxin [Acidobacteria bacterium]|nr:type II toxin-antitoxin system VapC family toxin [Acidobacteriota bacterium]